MKYLILCLAAITISCGSTSQEQGESTSDDNSVSKGHSCLSELTNPAQWYSKSAVASLFNVEEEGIDEKVLESFSSLQYKWDTDRTYIMKAGNIEMEVPSNNGVAIQIKNLDDAIEKAEEMHKKTFTYEEYFDGYHTPLTPEDEKFIDESIDEKGEEDEDFDAELVKELLAAAPSENSGKVQDLGEKANKYVQLGPGISETRLSVLQGNVVLQVFVDISDEDLEDLAAAIKIAEAVIALCD
jgi:hypothetical protein